MFVTRMGLVTLLATSVATLAPAPAMTAAAVSDYPAFLDGPAHHSFASSSTTITTANARSITQKLAWTPVAKAGQTGTLNASPIVSAGVIYIGAGTGDFYAVSAATGAVIWRKQLAIDNCASSGIVSSATVANDPVSGQKVVYVGGADHFLYALNAATGATIWRTVVGGTDPHYFNFSSPTVADGHVYMGVSTTCETPLGGGVEAFNQHTGAVTGRYFVSTPKAGASIYSSVAVDAAGNVYATSGDSNGSPPGDSTSMIKLSGGTLTRLAAWKIPGQESANLDFQASPTLFTVANTSMVGACDKNGVFYAFRADAIGSGPVWTRRLGISAPVGKLAFCGGSAVWDSSRGLLYVGANRKTAASTAPGGVYALNPATGAVVWFRALSGGPVVGNPSLDGAGVLAVPTFDIASGAHNAVYLINATNGQILKTINYGAAPIFAQPVFAAQKLFIAGPSLKGFGP